MNKIYISIILAIVVVIGIFALNNTNTAEYVATVNDEVTQLENELVALELAVTSGTLTEDQATEAKIKILTRLDSINTSMSSSNKATLTPAQRTQLLDGLDRLKTILIKYQATLVAIDDKAVDSKVSASLKKGGSSRKNQSLNLEVVDTIENVENVAEVVIEDYEPNTELDEQVDVVIEEETTMGDEETTDDNDSQEVSDESTDDSEMSDEDTEEVSNETPTLEDNDTTEIIIESSTTVETEEEITL